MDAGERCVAEVQELLKWMEARRVRGGLRWVAVGLVMGD